MLQLVPEFTSEKYSLWSLINQGLKSICTELHTVVFHPHQSKEDYYTTGTLLLVSNGIATSYTIPELLSELRLQDHRFTVSPPLSPPTPRPEHSFHYLTSPNYPRGRP